MFLLGYDIGSSSVKACILDAQSGKIIGSAFYPKQEAPIISHQMGWAEQEPESWWNYFKDATAEAISLAAHENHCTTQKISDGLSAIGISYQMHGLVCVDKHQQVLRPAIIWCDSRAVPYGQHALTMLGKEFCYQHLLNSPGNFTACKLAWVKEHEPEIFEKIDKIMLPGDYIAMRLTGNTCTTISGLSEAMLWDFKNQCICHELMEVLGFEKDLIPPIVPTFSEQGRVLEHIAEELGIKAGIPVTYRAGDQPNNALSLNVFQPGEIASTAGTSGVVYGVSDQANYDPQSRVNCFAHVNHTTEQTRLGVLLCINGTGILNSWIRRNVASQGCSYEELNQIAAQAPIGSEGLSILPFGNGAERILENQESCCNIHGINFNIHHRGHMVRAAQEGIVFAFRYGIDIMKDMGMNVCQIHAGKANMFLSPIFRQTLASVTGATIELYETDGAAGAARAAGIGANIYANEKEAFSSLKRLQIIEPEINPQYIEAYQRWLQVFHMINQ